MIGYRGFRTAAVVAGAAGGLAGAAYGLLTEQAPNAPGSSIMVRITEIDPERHRVRLGNA